MTELTTTPFGNDELDRNDMVRLAAGEHSALNELMARHAGRLHQYLRRVLQNESDAADLAEETFVRVFQHRLKFDSRKKFSTWLYTIATNLAKDLQRYRSRHPNVSLDAQPPEEGFALPDLLPHERGNPGEALELAERAAAVRQAVGELPEELRTPLILAQYEEKSQAEIGAILGCSPKAIEMRLYRARRELGRKLARWLA